MKKILLVLYPSLLLLSSCELRELEETNSCDAQGLRICNDRCVSITSDQHCGSCDNACKGHEGCMFSDGAYRCVPVDSECADENQRFCDNRCVDVNLKERCGSCDNACKSYQKCQKSGDAYACVNDCESPRLICDNECVPPSIYHCGSCYNACIGKQLCTESEGIFQCVDVNCLKPKVVTPDGSCVLPNTSQYCGDKAESCPEETHDCVSKKGQSQVFECVDRCENGRRDPGEDAVDCGGRCKACKKCSHKDNTCEQDEFCDSAVGYVCNKKCMPDNGEFNTASRNCAHDQICRADARCASKYFITEWQLNNPKDLSIQLFHDGKGACNFNIDWGDGKKALVVGCTSNKLKHVYEKVGTYTVKIEGIYDGWGSSLRSWRSSRKLTGIIAFGPVGLGEEAFKGCSNFNKIPKDEVPDATKMTDMSEMFGGERISFHPNGLTIFNQSIDHWDVSNVTDMSEMFQDARAFNQPIGNWDVSNVTSMSKMFYNATSFNQDLSQWRLDKISYMDNIFTRSGLSKENYCKMMKSALWKKFEKKLGITYSCG